jgi:hypothetical protein
LKEPSQLGFLKVLHRTLMNKISKIIIRKIMYKFNIKKIIYVFHLENNLFYRTANLCKRIKYHSGQGSGIRRMSVKIFRMKYFEKP